MNFRTMKQQNRLVFVLCNNFDMTGKAMIISISQKETQFEETCNFQSLSYEQDTIKGKFYADFIRLENGGFLIRSRS